MEASDGCQAGGHVGAELEGLASSRCTAVWVSHKDLGWCLALAQLQRPWPATNAVPGLWRMQGAGRRSGEGLRQRASGNAKSCGAKPV